MRRFSIHFSVENTDDYINNFNRLLSVISFEEKTTFEVGIDVSSLKALNAAVILELVKIEQEYGKKHKAIFKNTLCCQYTQINKKVLNCILRHGMELIVCYKGIFGKDKKLEKTLNKLQKNNIPYYLYINCALEECDYNYNMLIKTNYRFEIENAIISDVDLIKKFDHWCLEETIFTTFKTFEDILYKILLGQTHRNCKHSSCLGGKVSMKSNGDMYFCHINNNNTYLKNISEVTKFSDIYETSSFENVLVKSLERRNKCIECANFSNCQSGCPLLYMDKNEQCGEERYCKLLQHIAKYLHEKLVVNRELPQNPLIRRIILVSIACKGNIEINGFNKEVKK